MTPKTRSFLGCVEAADDGSLLDGGWEGDAGGCCACTRLAAHANMSSASKPTQIERKGGLASTIEFCIFVCEMERSTAGATPGLCTGRGPIQATSYCGVASSRSRVPIRRSRQPSVIHWDCHLST